MARAWLWRSRIQVTSPIQLWPWVGKRRSRNALTTPQQLPGASKARKTSAISRWFIGCAARFCRIPAVPQLSGHGLMAGIDNDHGARGTAWLARWFPPSVTGPVRLHVAAKRYLCAVEPAYFALLSPASVCTLSVQGGPMTDAEAVGFAAAFYAADAVAVRRWDGAAMDPAADVPGFDAYRPLLEGLLLAG